MNFNWFILNYIPLNILTLIKTLFFKNKINNRLIYLICTKPIFNIFKKYYKLKIKNNNKYDNITIKDCFILAENIYLEPAIASNIYIYFIHYLKLCSLHEFKKENIPETQQYYYQLFEEDNIEKITKDIIGLCTIKYIYTYLLNKTYASILNISMDMFQNKNNKKEYSKLNQYQLELKQQYSYLLSMLSSFN